MTKPTYIPIPAKGAIASRAVVAQQAGELPHIQINVTDVHNQVYQFDLPLREALIYADQLDASIEAALPNTRKRRGGFAI